jgi:hypothetical protein
MRQPRLLATNAWNGDIAVCMSRVNTAYITIWSSPFHDSHTRSSSSRSNEQQQWSEPLYEYKSKDDGLPSAMTWLDRTNLLVLDTQGCLSVLRPVGKEAPATNVPLSSSLIHWHRVQLATTRRWEDVRQMMTVRSHGINDHHMVWLLDHFNVGIWSISINIRQLSIYSQDDMVNCAHEIVVGTGRPPMDWNAQPVCTRLYHPSAMTGSPYDRHGCFYSDAQDGTIHRLSFGTLFVLSMHALLLIVVRCPQMSGRSQKMVRALMDCCSITKLYEDIHFLIVDYCAVLISTHIAGIVPSIPLRLIYTCDCNNH